tara:strand:+ start:571 stop:1818 length:1248 start_codon:yes stop_codon:yes gene_type:complete
VSEIKLAKYLQLALFSAVVLGGYLLENLGIAYVSEGGSPVVKIHLYAYILLALFGLLVLSRGMAASVAELGQLASIWWWSFIALSAVIVYGLATQGTSGMAYMVNTFLAPLLLLVLLAQLSHSQLQRILVLLAYLLLFNSLLAVGEYVLNTRIVSVEFDSFAFFRSTALMTHPLNNALITVALALLLCSYTRLPAFAYIGLVILALFAFGGRAALALFCLGALVCAVPALWRFLTRGVAVDRRYLAVLMMLGYFAFIAFIVVLIESGITERIASKMYIDHSATARLDVFYLLEQLSPKEWVFGASASLMAAIEFYIDISVIENYLVGWIFNFGLIGAVPLFIAAFLPLGYFFYHGNLVSRTAIGVFMIVGVTNNSLTTKTPVLLLLYCALFCALKLQQKAQQSIRAQGASHACAT